MDDQSLFPLWCSHHNAPYHFPMDEKVWADSMYADVDSDGRKLFSELITETAGTALIQYGLTALGFDDSGEVSDSIYHKVIRILCFAPDHPEDGRHLLRRALQHFGSGDRIYAFFHYFGMSACGRHGKLHEQDRHIEAILLENGFTAEHENVYYAKELTGQELSDGQITLQWCPLSPGNCREFAASSDGREIGWGQIHFLPQKEIAYLRWIYIDENMQHQGFGSAVMRSLFGELAQIGIRRFDTDTALNNKIAQQYYEKNGFSNKGITRSYHTR